MQKDTKFYMKLFWATFSLSAFTFGGGYVIVPLMQKRFVDENHWLEESEMLDIVAISQSAPGVIAVNTSILAGYRMAGLTGAFLATFATVLPPLIIITVISFFYAAFRDSAAVSAVMHAMQAGVAAVIIDAVFKMGKTAGKGKNPAVFVIMAACFIAAFFLHINVAVIILVCGVLGAAKTVLQGRRKGASDDLS